jgi:hypothetical protein
VPTVSIYKYKVQKMRVFVGETNLNIDLDRVHQFTHVVTQNIVIHYIATQNIVLYYKLHCSQSEV